jgi:hypothetical protein
MEEKNLKSWEEYETEIRKLMEVREERKQEVQTYLSPMLFRGQANKDWRLETTLERYALKTLRAKDYYSVIHGAKYGIESLTGQTWNISIPPEYDEWLSKQDAFGLYDLPGYDYIVYLRHHGFPSPLLDWTRSPYIAAFFAFINNSTKGEYVSVYVFIEQYGRGKIGKRGDPRICGCGPYVRSHKRHVLQQSEYTICTKMDNGQWSYTCHEDVLSKNEIDQDVLWKLNIPSEQRLKALGRLDQSNINAYSLFGSEESLMDTMAFREFTKRFSAL